jgi:hypothetical protein
MMLKRPTDLFNKKWCLESGTRSVLGERLIDNQLASLILVRNRDLGVRRARRLP